MIAAATAPGKLLFNWFDVAVILLIGFGFWRGRRNGMTKEILPVAQWLAIVIAAGFLYQMLGDFLRQQGFIRDVFGKSVNEKTAAYLSSYLAIAIVVFTVFSVIKRFLNPRLEGSNLFGDTEYYFGMISGIIRYLCILIFGLAILNAPFYSTTEIQAAKAYNNRWFGGGLNGYSGDFFPTVSELQMTVFKESLTGPAIRSYLGALLVTTATQKQLNGVYEKAVTLDPGVTEIRTK
jgi:uncharacterized membrane protein required for colicin V production